MSEGKGAVTQFKVEFFVDGSLSEDLTTHWSTIRIINSTRSIWPIFYFYFFVDNQVFIEKNIYGSQDIKCKISITYEDGKKSNPIEFELIYIEAKIDLPPKNEKNVPYDHAKEVQRKHIMVTCLAKPAYLAMTTFVNKLWEEPTEKTPLDMVKEILKDGDIDTSKIIDEGKNEDKIQQMLIPPMTMKSAVDYINQNYGIYTGPVFRYCNYSGQFLMWDLKKMYDKKKDNPWVKFHKSPSHFETPGKFEEINKLASSTEDEFVTHRGTETIHHPNANLIRYGYDNIYIYHPHEDIVVFQKKNVDDIISDYGIWHSKEEMKYHPDLKNRKIYFSDMQGFETGTGYSGEYNDAILTQDMATSFQNTAAIRMILHRNVKLPMALKVGEVLYMKPYSDFEFYSGSSYEGGYLISDSEVVLTKEKETTPDENISCMATLTGYRTAQSKD